MIRKVSITRYSLTSRDPQLRHPSKPGWRFGTAVAATALVSRWHRGRWR
jgi:hypothetical protein